MNVQERNNVHVTGEGPATVMLAHGFRCDQNMWRLLVPDLEQRFRVVLFDLVGSGKSDLAAMTATSTARCRVTQTTSLRSPMGSHRGRLSSSATRSVP